MKDKDLTHRGARRGWRAEAEDLLARKRGEPNGTTLTVEEWIELMNSCDRLEQYAKQRREEADDE